MSAFRKPLDGVRSWRHTRPMIAASEIAKREAQDLHSDHAMQMALILEVW